MNTLPSRAPRPAHQPSGSSVLMSWGGLLAGMFLGARTRRLWGTLTCPPGGRCRCLSLTMERKLHLQGSVSGFSWGGTPRPSRGPRCALIPRCRLPHRDPPGTRPFCEDEFRSGLLLGSRRPHPPSAFPQELVNRTTLGTICTWPVLLPKSFSLVTLWVL